MNWWRPVETSESEAAEVSASGVRLLVDRKGCCPDIDAGAWDICLTPCADAPRPWIAVQDVETAEFALQRRVRQSPVAARILLDLLRDGEGLPRAARLRMESLAYAALQGAVEFRRWCADRPFSPSLARPANPVRYEREGDIVRLILSDPDSRNAYSAAMRDSLIHHLDTCLIDPTDPTVLLCGEGLSFCTGGALEEFGLATDPARAHALRMETSAVSRLWALGDRASATVHGPVIGSGLEIAAAAASLQAHEGSWFQLPELAMGLLPGAGGTVTVTDRIGRHRAAWMMLAAPRIRDRQARAWGLIDAIVRQ